MISNVKQKIAMATNIKSEDASSSRELRWKNGKWEAVSIRPFDPKNTGITTIPIDYAKQVAGLPGIGYCKQILPLRMLQGGLPPEKIASALSEFRSLLGKWNSFTVSALLSMIEKREQLSVYKAYFKTERDIIRFIKDFPQYFAFIDNENIALMQNRFFKADFVDFLKLQRISSFPRRRETHTVIDTVKDCRKVVTKLRNRARLEHASLVLGVDCEGIKLGKEGALTLVQISTEEGEAFIFDILATLNKEDMFNEGGLKDFFEDDNIMKVFHDCRADQCALFFQFNVIVKNVFDTSVAYTTIWDQCNTIKGPYRPKFSFLIELYQCKAPFKTEAFQRRIHNTGLWGDRPLTEEMISYAVDDVLCLVPVIYKQLDSLISPLWRPYFESKVLEDLRESRISDPRDQYK